MKKLLFASACLLFAVSCTKKDAQPITSGLCDVAVSSITGAAQGVANALGCKNVHAIATTLSKPVKDLAVCQETASGLVGDLVCPQVTSFVVGMGMSSLPAEWECSGGTIGDSAGALIAEQCKKMITF